MVNIVKITGAYRGIKSILLIAIILLFRNILNRSSIKRANKVLWTILLIFLLFPFSIVFEVYKTVDYGLFNIPIKVLLSISGFTRQLTNSVADVLSRLNIYIIATLFVIYLIAKIVERNKAMQGSKLLENNNFVNELIDDFHIRRKVTVLINDNLSTPVTYGVFKPKIVLQSYILEDEELLEHVLVHELTHIKYFDIAFTHIKNIALCLYWYNIAMWIASKFFEDDLEILCDKKVLERLGNTQENKKAYAMSMFKIMESENRSENLVLSLNPQKERIILMKEYRRKFSGLVILLVALILAFSTFVEVLPNDTTKVISIDDPNTFEGIRNERVKIISAEENKKSNSLKEYILIDALDEEVSGHIDDFDHRSYEVNMSSFYGKTFDDMIIDISDIECESEAKFLLEIEENGDLIFSDILNKDTRLKIEGCSMNKYKIIIDNFSEGYSSYRIKVQKRAKNTK